MNIECRVISFRQHKEAPEEIYFLSERPLEIGCFYYNRELGASAAIQHCLEPAQLESKCPRVEATSSDKYELKKVPPAFIKGYFESGKQIKSSYLRLP